MPAVRLSRYEYAPVEVDECGRVFLDVPDPIQRITRPTDLKAVASQSDTLFAAAWKAYRDTLDYEQDIRPTSFWDVIAQTNDLIDAIPVLEEGRLDIEPGTVMRIPDVETLLGEIRIPPPFFSRTSADLVTP